MWEETNRKMSMVVIESLPSSKITPSRECRGKIPIQWTGIQFSYQRKGLPRLGLHKVREAEN